MALLGTLLAEERRHPELLEVFRTRLAGPRRALLRQALADGIRAGELPPSADPDVLTTMLIGSFLRALPHRLRPARSLGPADTRAEVGVREFLQKLGGAALTDAGSPCRSAAGAEDCTRQ